MKRILLYGLLLAAIGLQAQDVLPYPTDTIDGKVYYRYTVEKSIGLYRISKNFGVTQEAILEANPELKSRGLRYEEVIRIPTNLPATKKEAAVPQEKPTEIARPQEKIRPIVIEKLPELPKREIAEQRIEVTAVADTTRVEEVKDEVAEFGPSFGKCRHKRKNVLRRGNVAGLASGNLPVRCEELHEHRRAPKRLQFGKQ